MTVVKFAIYLIDALAGARTITVAALSLSKLIKKLRQ